MAQIALILMLVSVGGVAGGGGLWYFQHEVIETCNAHWRREIQDATLKALRTTKEGDQELDAARVRALQGLEGARKSVAPAAGDVGVAGSQPPAR